MIIFYSTYIILLLEYNVVIYLGHIDIIRDKTVPVVEGTQKEITHKVYKIFKLKSKGNKPNISKC